MWFDDTYLPESPEFIAAFSENELAAIEALNTSLEKLSMEAGDPPPQVEEFFKMQSWAEVKFLANAVLEAVVI
jgi:hypothetical protein